MNKSYLWTRPHVLSRDYVLLRDDREIASLAFPGLPETRAHARWCSVEWTFEQSTLSRPIVTAVRNRDAQPVIAGALQIGGSCSAIWNDQLVHWKTISIWSGELGWVTDLGAMVAHYRPRHSKHRLGYEIEVQTPEVSEEAATLLLLFGGYLISMTNAETATISAVLTSTSHAISD
jgi:hypothetical protein